MPFTPTAENLLRLSLYVEQGYENVDIVENLQDRREGNIRNQKFC